ncbi:YwmB family TATA-box binding protein [Oceanobacillus sp. J11TS1]|uniref:YwmB family TATA-box binding protein n=1 Tax=Oceanobacillus sp. J11TS1 TaxID=2807191 RepID=UPI001B28A63A|nr:YwmB family TATA-box binding protein [Oceanobacillus sp. J11TS1]GIO24716.1 hypothetical protein J11TS1_32970 [Oceanobacillus sp. J11TS1]
MFHRFLTSFQIPFTQQSPSPEQKPIALRKQAICLLLIISFFVNQAFSQPIQNDEMEDLAAFANEYDLEMNFWEVTMKEQMDSQRAEEIVQGLQETHISHEEKDENRIKHTFESRHKKDTFDVLYKVILPIDKRESAEVIIVMHGTDWDNHISQKYREEKTNILRNYLTKESHLYTCLSVQDSGIMNHDVFINKAKTYFNIKHISTNYDNIKNSTIKKSTYGYTKTWKQFYYMEDDPKNVQIAAVADRHGKMNYMIGTPILINEY